MFTCVFHVSQYSTFADLSGDTAAAATPDPSA
jgi:hypothetical protein